MTQRKYKYIKWKDGTSFYYASVIKEGTEESFHNAVRNYVWYAEMYQFNDEERVRHVANSHEGVKHFVGVEGYGEKPEEITKEEFDLNTYFTRQ